MHRCDAFENPPQLLRHPCSIGNESAVVFVVLVFSVCCGSALA